MYVTVTEYPGPLPQQTPQSVQTTVPQHYVHVSITCKSCCMLHDITHDILCNDVDWSND